MCGCWRQWSAYVFLPLQYTKIDMRNPPVCRSFRFGDHRFAISMQTFTSGSYLLASAPQFWHRPTITSTKLQSTWRRFRIIFKWLFWHILVANGGYKWPFQWLYVDEFHAALSWGYTIYSFCRISSSNGWSQGVIRVSRVISIVGNLNKHVFFGAHLRGRRPSTVPLHHLFFTLITEFERRTCKIQGCSFLSSQKHIK